MLMKTWSIGYWLRRDTVNDKDWLLIEPVSGRGETGWAFARFLDCDGG